MEILISSIHPTEVQPTHDQPITSVISHSESSYATLRIDKGKRIATESDVDPSKIIVPASTIIRPDPDEPASSQSSGRKGKHIELELEVKVLGLECNRSLFEGIPFVNHMVIEEPEYGIFFIDVFGDQAFQRWDDIHKVGVDSLVSYLVMASMAQTKENARFSLKLRKMIADHPDQDKLKSKKVKLEALGYHVERSTPMIIFVLSFIIDDRTL
ncbi:hypothetical protein Tco_0528607 [Tanacetum coccineum]